MGKKKTRTEKSSLNQQPESKTQKNYSFAAEAKSSKKDGEDSKLIKVQIPARLEATILDVILEHKRQQSKSGKASFRITSKKLTDMYMSLAETGFTHGQIENGMSNMVQYGGDLMDVLDWLCLNTPNDRLPDGFSQSLAKEDKKKKPKFREEVQKMCTGLVSCHATKDEVAQASKSQTRNVQESVPPRTQDKQKSPASVKSWILQYAEHSSDSEEFTDPDDGVDDPNCRYLELVAKFLDARQSAADAKHNGDKTKAKSIGKQIEKHIQEMNDLEHHPAFDPSIRIKDVDKEKKATEREISPVASEAPFDDRNTDDALGLSIFQEESTEKPKATVSVREPKYEKRCFTYTRQQWTGKSPKQFLIDWIRKNLPKSPPPSYKHVKVSGNLWKSRVRVIKKEGVLDVCVDDIVCENVKEAEHLASTLALYRLCKGQRVYQLLPPPYRDLWLDWQDKDSQLIQEAKAEENKPRDMFIARLMKKLKIDTTKVTSGEQSDEDVEETWEDLAEDDAIPKTNCKLKHGASAERFQSIMERNQASLKYRDLMSARQQLPIFSYKDYILDVIREHNVVVIAGETGCGKSTQIPQFILEGLIQSGEIAGSSIVCTEPRRISAVSLSVRVCQELGQSKPGVKDTLCGYQIRFESKKSDMTRLVYCTTGVLLRQLQQDPELKNVTHFIVDEVHERSVQSDFLLILLRRLLEKRPDIKVILMSATMDAGKFSSYFQHCPVIEVPGRTYPVEVHHLEDILEVTGYTLESGSFYSLRPEQIVEEHQSRLLVTGKQGNVSCKNVDWTKEDLSRVDLSDLDSGQYSLKTRNIVTRMNPKRVNLELIMDLIVYLDEDPEYSSIDGAILVFLPGLVHIQDLYDSLKADRRFNDENRYNILALHSVLSSDDQGAAFKVPPPGVRKIVIATNIAETGITIPDVVFVIDSGKVKENRYLESHHLCSLEEVFISQASAKQRQGRAGRVREGVCFRLYTHRQYEHFQSYSVPEILRVPLEELCLHIMKCELGSAPEFLSQALDPPNSTAIQHALNILYEADAYDPVTTTLTPLGHHLAALPVNVRIGKMLIYGAIFGCLQPTAIIAAALSEKSPFSAPINKREMADVAKQSLSTANSDHLTLLRAFLMWHSVRHKGYQAEIELCNKFFLKRSTLMEINNIAEDLIQLVVVSGLAGSSTDGGQQTTLGRGQVITFTPDQLSAKMAAKIKAVLTAGLYPNVAHVEYTPRVDSVANPERNVCMAETGHGILQLHPASINRYLMANGWLVYHEKIKLGRPYIRDSSLISSYPLLLFGGNIAVEHKDQIIAIDNWIRLKACAKTAVIFKELRKLISCLLSDKLDNPNLDIKDNPVTKAIEDLIATEQTSR
ncbi:hypothetical protein LSH36_353g09030 [Paralvinella palmiformis]|uniref:RNA helicase n=1 Tax=Paralvinella palmiformis TaxID=53620 RepID=A0AAD9JFF9_9ANNE|nr:hypothetical protein LSH36_353g09030 [Paralvinella palmiformis]